MSIQGHVRWCGEVKIVVEWREMDAQYACAVITPYGQRHIFVGQSRAAQQAGVDPESNASIKSAAHAALSFAMDEDERREYNTATGCDDCAVSDYAWINNECDGWYITEKCELK